MPLSSEADKLVALVGLVVLLQEHFPDHDLFGLWRSQLLPRLTWKVAATAKEVEEIFIAPSWPWASSNINIKFPSFAGRGASG
jgi:hypothetical protein